MKCLSSRDNPFFKMLLKLAGAARQRHKVQQTLLDGAHLLQACLASGGQPLHVLLNETSLQHAELVMLLEKIPDVPRTQLSHALFAELSDLKTTSGILTLIDIPAPAITPAYSKFCLLLEDIQDPGNAGSILRSAAAAGCDAVYLSPGCADVWSPKVLRASMGGHFVLSIHPSADLLAVARALPGKIFATSLQAENNLYASNLCGNLAFAMGNEGAGLSPDLLAEIHHSIAIPMPGKVESLNVAAATAICLFEALRQRDLSSGA